MMEVDMTASEQAILSVIVGSTSSVKINAVASAFSRVFPHRRICVQPVEVCNGVSEQPYGEIETKRGAINRALEAEASYVQTLANVASFFVGIEGGVADIEGINVVTPAGGTLESFAWIAVRSASGTWGFSRTASLQLPPSVVRLLREGVELGEANDRVKENRWSRRHPHTWPDGPYGILQARACSGFGSCRESWTIWLWHVCRARHSANYWFLATI